MKRLICVTVISALATAKLLAGAEAANPVIAPANHPLEFIDTSFENASPVWYEFATDGTVLVHLLYDHERSSPNRAAGHIHFQLHAKPGARLTLEFRNLDNVWNGVGGSVARESKTVVISEDGREWKSVPTESLPENRVRLHVTMPGPRLYVARVEPYRLSDLDRFLAAIRTNRLVQLASLERPFRAANWKLCALVMPARPIVFFFARERIRGNLAGTGWWKDSSTVYFGMMKTRRSFWSVTAFM